MKTFTLALVLVGTLIFSLGSTLAVSPSGKGATVINIDTCAPIIGGYGTVCITSKGMINETITPSGNESYVTNYRERIWVIANSGEITWDQTSSERFHALTKDDVLQELSSRSRFTITSFGQTFCVQYHLHGTNGVDQFVRIDFCD
jgi:hypothetical protein